MSGTVQKCNLCTWSVYDDGEGVETQANLQDTWLGHLRLTHPASFEELRYTVQGARDAGQNVWVTTMHAPHLREPYLLACCVLCGTGATPWYSTPTPIAQVLPKHFGERHVGERIQLYGSSAALKLMGHAVASDTFWAEPPNEGEAHDVDDQPKLDGIRSAMKAIQAFSLAIIPVAEQLSRHASELARELQEALRKPPAGG